MVIIRQCSIVCKWNVVLLGKGSSASDVLWRATNGSTPITCWKIVKIHSLMIQQTRWWACDAAYLWDRKRDFRQYLQRYCWLIKRGSGKPQRSRKGLQSTTDAGVKVLYSWRTPEYEAEKEKTQEIGPTTKLGTITGQNICKVQLIS